MCIAKYGPFVGCRQVYFSSGHLRTHLHDKLREPEQPVIFEALSSQ
jgi:hypothetical protein